MNGKKRMNQTGIERSKDLKPKPNRKNKPKQKSRFRRKIILAILYLIAITGIIMILDIKKIVSYKNPYVLISGGAILLIIILITILRAKKQKVKIKTKDKEENSEKNTVIAKSNKYQTDLDKLYEMVEKKGKVKLQDVAKKFKISLEKAEEWAKILENHEMITLNYPAFGEVELCKKP